MKKERRCTVDLLFTPTHHINLMCFIDISLLSTPLCIIVPQTPIFKRYKGFVYNHVMFLAVNGQINIETRNRQQKPNQQITNPIAKTWTQLYMIANPTFR